jgi:hypothetical protein
MVVVGMQGLLFNLGALWAELGRRVLINAGGEPSDQNLKQAVKYFQAAGGAYTQLTELIDAHPTAVVGKDSTAHWITMLEKLMLAQAHECVLRQALSIQRKQEVTQPDKKKSEFFPKLAMQVAELYDQVSGDALATASPLREGRRLRATAHHIIAEFLR